MDRIAYRNLVALGLTAAIASGALAETITIRRDTVVPIRFTEELSLKNSRQGDRVWARVDSDRDLPAGSWLGGRITRLERDRNGRQGFARIEFTTLELPDRSRHKIQAVPISLNSEYVYRGGDGRLVVRHKEGNREKLVLGGMIGGLILGNSIKKPFEGAFLGTLIGIVAAEAERAETEKGVFVKKNARMGAWFERDAKIRFEGRWNPSGNPDDPRYRDDSRDDGRFDDRYDGRYENRYRREPEIRYGDRVLRYSDAQPYWDGGTCMVPLLETCRHVGLSAERTGSGRYYVESEETVLVFEQNSHEYRLNGRRQTLPAPTMEQGGVLYVPVEVLARVAPKTIVVDGTKIGK